MPQGYPKDTAEGMRKALYWRCRNLELDVRDIKATLSMAELHCRSPELAREQWSRYPFPAPANCQTGLRSSHRHNCILRSRPATELMAGALTDPRSPSGSNVRPYLDAQKRLAFLSAIEGLA